MNKVLALLLMLYMGTALSQNTTTTPVLTPGEVYSTGNLVQMTTTTSGSTWTNAVYQDNLTCFAWGNPGYCGPNPIVRPGNNINFSYGWTDIYQQIQLTTSAALSVPGLRVNGYNFGFTAKNGNGWDDGRTDLLFAYVQFNDAQGGTLLNHTHNLSYKFDWSRFEYNKTFDSPYALKDISSVRYGFVGQDNNGWAGPYGPEIYNITFGIKYSVDPCANDPLASPTCPGYMEALNKLLPPPILVEPTTTTATATGTTVTSEPAVAIAPSTTSVSTAPTAQSSVIAPVVSAPAPVAASNTSNSTASTATTSTTARENTGGNTAQALSIISRNQERDRETLAVAQTAVAAASAAAAAAQQEAVAVASVAVANSTVNNAATTAGSNNAGASSRSAVVSNNTAAQTSVFQLMSGMSAMSVNSPQSQNTSISTSTVGSSVIAETAPVAQTQSLTTSGSGSSIVDTTVLAASNFLMDRTNPINNIMEQRLTSPASTTPTTGPSVNTRAADNEAAGGVSLAVMAVAPVGYGDYLNFTLRDAAFYAPREVYRNQRTVDNARALRQLTNDNRHREMVEQQYRR